jgi:hypothetical protein
MKIFFGILFFAIVSCGQNDSVKKTQFLKFKKTIVSTIFNSYPIKEEDVEDCEVQIINYTDSYKYLGYASMFQIYKYTDDEFIKRRNYIIAKSRLIVDNKQKCNFIIPDMIDSYDKLCKGEIYPVIPSLDDTANKLNRFVKESSKFYILEYGNKNIMNNIVPEKKQFSIGAIVDESNKTILYWIIAL